MLPVCLVSGLSGTEQPTVLFPGEDHPSLSQCPLFAIVPGAQSQWICLQNTKGPGNTVEERAERSEEPEDQGVCCESMSSGVIRSHAHKAHDDIRSHAHGGSPAWLSKYELNKSNAKEFTKPDVDKLTRP